MAKNYQKMAQEILELVGGKDNVNAVTHCLTRLRFSLADESKVQMDALKKVEGVINVVIAGNQYQVVIGTDVPDVYEELLKLGVSSDEASAEASGKKSDLLTKASAIIGKVFMPFIGVFAAAGLLKGLTILLTTYCGVDTASTTYTILNAIGDGIFTFLPIFVAVTTAKTFGANIYVSMAVAAALVHPGISALFDMFGGGDPVTFFGIPVEIISYTCSVMPIFAAVIVQSKLEKLLKRIVPKTVASIINPFISLIVTSLLTFLVIGPITNWISELLASGITMLIAASPAVAGLVLGALYPVMIVFGLHWGLVPVFFVNFTAQGFDNIMVFTVATNFAIAGAALGVYLKTKNNELKTISMPAFLSAAIGGITEPAIYGCLLKFKWPFVIVCVVDAISGALIGITNTVQYSTAGANIISIPALVAGSSIWTLWAILIGFVGGAVLTYLVGYSDKMLENSK